MFLRYLDSIICQSFAKHPDSEQKPPNYLSMRPTYYTNGASCADDLQRDLSHITCDCVSHSCGPTCFKNGHKTCRFNYPLPIVEVTGFKDGVIQLKRHDSNCNNYNRTIISALRCNMDVKFVTNGADAKATIFYITGNNTHIE